MALVYQRIEVRGGEQTSGQAPMEWMEWIMRGSTSLEQTANEPGYLHLYYSRCSSTSYSANLETLHSKPVHPL